MYGYICKACEFYTETKNTFKRHFNSKKHIENVGSEVIDDDSMIPTYICIECCTTFTQEKNMKRHINGTCGVIKQKYTGFSKKDMELSELKKEVKNMAEKIVELSSTCMEITKQNVEVTKKNAEVTEQNVKLSKKCVESNTENCKSTLAIVKYVMGNHQNAPKLQSPKNILKKLDNNEESDKEIIYKYKNKLLDEYIGDFIVKEYKKIDPLDQSMWSSDTLRFTYIIMGEEWVRDKNGEKIIDKIISKIINKIKEINKKFMIKCSYVTSTQNGIKSKHKIKLSNDHYLWDCTTSQIADWMSLSMDLDKKLDTNELCKQVLKYISPKFDIATLAQEIKNNNI